MNRKPKSIIGGLLLAPLVLLAVLPTPANAYPRPGITERVSVASDGSEARSHSVATAISADGRFVAFHSLASNLVLGDTNGALDVFVHDREIGATERVSVASGGAGGNGLSGLPTISADGRHVAFFSLASNLVPGDTNGQQDVFVHDRETGATERVSVATGGTEGNDWSSWPAISADGRHVAFQSLASNLTPGDTNGVLDAFLDVFVHDRETGITNRVSVASNGTGGIGDSVVPAISADGRHVAFRSAAPNLVLGDTNGTLDVFVHDREAGTTERASVASGGTEGNGNSLEASISADGRHVAFISRSSNLVPGDTNSRTDVFVHDRETAATERVSVASDGTEAPRGSFLTPVISADGRHVAFRSSASNLVPEDANEETDVFVHDRETGVTERVSVASDGSEAEEESITRAISADGRFVAFWSLGSGLVPGDTNGSLDVFVRDRGPATGVAALEVQKEPGELVVSGLATFSGATVTSAEESPDDGVGAVGAEITGASVIHRPEQEDFLVRMDLASLPGLASPPCVAGNCLTVHPEPPSAGGGAPGILYRWAFTAAETAYEVRALRAAATADPSTTDPSFGLYECAATCTKIAQLSGGIGTTGEEVRVSVPLEALGAEEGVTLTDIEASAAVGEATPGAVVVLDEAALADAALPVAQVELGIAPPSVPQADVPFFGQADLVEGRFSGSLDVSSVAPGDHHVWARACLGKTCGAALTLVTLGDGKSPPPTPTPTESPVLEATEVAFTEDSATSGQHTDGTLFEAQVTDSDGDPIEDATLTFTLTGEETAREFTATTDQEGLASVTPTLTEKPGAFQLTARYAGDETHTGSADTTAFVIDKEDTDLALTVEGTGNNKTLSARLSDLDTSSEGIEGRAIDFYSDGELIGSAQTDDDGVAAIPVPPGHRGANRTYEAVFAGDDLYRASSDEPPGEGPGREPAF